MKRDLDLIRKILLWIEEHGRVHGRSYPCNVIKIEGYNALEIDFHVRLLQDCNYIETPKDTIPNPHYAHVSRLTMQGCDYLDSVRDESIWKQTREKIAKVGGAVTLELVKNTASAILQSYLGL